jgi:cystathionine beta-synthase
MKVSAMYYKSLLDTIGNTPLIKVPFATPATILAKLEYLNPGGSIKDRSALFMIEEAERKGLIQPGGTLIEASSGNQGIATAMIGAAKGYRVIITTNEKFSADKIKAIRAYGAQIVMCPVTQFVEDPASYHSQAVTIQKATPNSFMLNQYYNLDNAEAHYRSLGPELWHQTRGTITHFFAAAGTCGTITGIGRYLKEQNPAIKVIALDSINSYRATQGMPKPYKLEGIGIDFDAPILAAYQSVIDEFICVEDKPGFDALKMLARNFGLLCGPSSGAVVHGLLTYLPKLTEHDVVVIMLADSGRAYLNHTVAYAQEDCQILQSEIVYHRNL